MGIFLYYLIIRIYNFLLFTTSLFSRKADLIIQGRKKTFSKIKKLRGPDDKIIWFHCASLGEFEQGRPVMESIREKWGNYKIYVSFFSSSGYEVRKMDPLLDGVFYLPADTRKNAHKLVSLLKPEVAIFVKYEFWYFFLNACNKNNIPVLSISTILRPDQVFFKFYGKFYREILGKVDAYFVQDQQTRDLLKDTGINRVQVTGDTRFDQVLKIKRNHQPVPFIQEFIKGRRLIILGSTWKPDIDLWESYIKENREEYRYLIAPHHIDEGNLKYIESRISLKSIRFTRRREDQKDHFEVMIMDRIGLLSSLYYYGYVNYVGGSFSEGLHNLLEPAVFGTPVLFGKDKTNIKYLEAMGLIEEGGAFEISGPDELARTMHELSGESSRYREAGDRAREYVESHAGATEKIVSSLEFILIK